MGAFDYGLKLRKALAKKHISQSDLARKLGVTPGFISQLVVGYRKPGRDTLIKIAEALDLPVEEFLPEKVTGSIPVVMTYADNKMVKESAPEHWSPDNIQGYLPLPPGYTAKGALKDQVFGMFIESTRLYPMLRQGWKVYLKPHEITTYDKYFNDLFLAWNDDTKECCFKEIESLDKSLIIKDILSGTSIVHIKTKLPQKLSLYRIITILT